MNTEKEREEIRKLTEQIGKDLKSYLLSKSYTNRQKIVTLERIQQLISESDYLDVS